MLSLPVILESFAENYMHLGVLGAASFSLYMVLILGKVTWNIYFHPLSTYPGPKLFAATSFVNTFLLIRGIRVYEVAKLHDRYGPVVRIAPNELSFVDEEAWKGIYTTHKTGQLQKYYITDPLNHHSLFSSPTDGGHNLLRKKISPAFSDKNVRDREGILRQYIDMLITRVRESKGKPLDMLFWYECTTLDITGHLTLGDSFKCLETATIHPLMVTALGVFKSITLIIDLFHYPLVPWAIFIMSKITENPFVEGVIGRTIRERLHRMEKADYMEYEDLSPHITYLQRGKGTDKELPSPVMHQVTADLLAAGSDTVATVLTATTYLLLTHPKILSRLQAELHSSFESSSSITIPAVLPLRYLTAVIHESMRLFPAVPETFRRVTNPGGNVICGKLVPAGTAVGVYHWAAGHNAASWRDAGEFVPERWLGDDERYEGDRRGVVQFFNVGPRNCVGQTLANAELRLILANIFWEFDLELLPESKTWGDMRSWGLIYDKRHLMVRTRRSDSDSTRSLTI